MPKNKTHSGTKKRVRVTGSGKLMREKANARHLLEHKSSTRKRRLGSDTDVAKALAREVASRGITVNVVAPGLIDTDMTRALATGTAETWAQQIPLGRLGSPEDVAGLAVFLASADAQYVTGATYTIDGAGSM